MTQLPTSDQIPMDHIKEKTENEWNPKSHDNKTASEGSTTTSAEKEREQPKYIPPEEEHEEEALQPKRLMYSPWQTDPQNWGKPLQPHQYVEFKRGNLPTRKNRGQRFPFRNNWNSNRSFQRRFPSNNGFNRQNGNFNNFNSQERQSRFTNMMGRNDGSFPIRGKSRGGRSLTSFRRNPNQRQRKNRSFSAGVRNNRNSQGPNNRSYRSNNRTFIRERSFYNFGGRRNFGNDGRREDNNVRQRIYNFIKSIDMELVKEENKTEVQELRMELLNLNIPKKPISAFQVFQKQEKNANPGFQNLPHGKLIRIFKSKWSQLSYEDKTPYYDASKQSKTLFNQQMTIFNRTKKDIQTKIEQFQGKNPSKIKYLSAFRLFRKELAPQLKDQMGEAAPKERQLVIKQKWKELSNSQKMYYVMMSRMAKENAIFQNRQESLQRKINLLKPESIESKDELPTEDEEKITEEAEKAEEVEKIPKEEELPSSA